jgi:MinD superfamily P-loop ATPase
MRIAVASGKGGTGKTTIATNLAWMAIQNNFTVTYADCDVEEPNGYIFLKPVIQAKRTVTVSVPSVNEEQCIHCGLCGQICNYSSIVLIGNQVLLFPELCHSCGGCWLVCPTEAVRESHRVIGFVESGGTGDIQFVQGSLNIGEAMSPPVIRAVKADIQPCDLAILDAPPGTSCSVIETLRGCDYVILVTEATPFGLHDLTLAVGMVRALGISFGIVINRTNSSFSEVQNYCFQQQIPILAEIPEDRRIAKTYSQGGMMCEYLPEYRSYFTQIMNAVERKPDKLKVG